MSSLRVNAITDTSGGSTNLTVSGKNTAKAWVSFNGTGTVAIISQFNVSSITDNGTGDYTVNFASTLTDANYAVSGSSVGYSLSDNAGNVVAIANNGTAYQAAALKSSSALRITAGSNGLNRDSNPISVIIFGN